MSATPHRTDLSKWVSWALRHDPNAAGITLDAAGWTPVTELLAAAQRARQALTREVLDEIVATSDKKRFAFSADGALIRANQGHSVNVELGLAPQVPPEVLYHGTAERFVTAILAEGLRRGSRHHVHLSADVETDSRVGVRHGRLVLFSVAAQRMHSAGLPFFCSDNGVWLAEAVPPEYLTRLSR